MMNEVVVRSATVDTSACLIPVQQVSTWFGRAIIAVGQMSIVLFSSRAHLTPVTSEGDSFVCEGMATWGAYCVFPDPVGSVVVLAILGAVCLGLAPLLTGVLHAWVSFSIATGVGLPDGGEHVAQVVTLLLVFMLLGDARTAAWRRIPAAGSQVLVGISMAAWWFLRLQMAGIYLHSAIAKLGVATLTWGSIVVEIAVAILLLHRGRARVLALGLAVALHTAIIVAIGLWSFGLVMIGAMVVATAPDRIRSLISCLPVVFRRAHENRGES